MKKALIYYGVIMLVLLGITLWLFSIAANKDAECKQTGGILIKSYANGLVCIDPSYMK